MPLFSFKNDKNTTASAFSVRIAYIIGGFLTFLIVFQMLQFYELRNKLQFLDGIEESQSAVVEQVSLSQNYLSQFATDLNQIRQFLLLPESDYDFSGLGEVDLEAEEVDLTAQIFDLVDALGKAEKNESYYQSRLSEIKEYLSVSEVFLNKGVTVNPEGTQDLESINWAVIDSESGETILLIKLAYDAELNLSYLNGGSSFGADIAFSNISKDISTVMGGLDSFRTSIALQKKALTFLENELFPSELFQNYLQVNKLKLSSLKKDDKSSFYSLTNLDQTDVASFQISKTDASTKLTFNETVIELSLDQSGIDKAISSLKELVDTRTILDIKIEDRRKELAQLMQDRGFISTLEALGLTMGEIVVEDTRLFYSIMNAEGIVLRNLVLDFATGEVQIEMPGSGEVESLALAIDQLRDFDKKKLSNYLT